MDFTVALAQIKPKLGCVADNLALIEQAVDRGIREQAGLVIFPELALTGYFLKDLVPEVALPLDAPELRRLVELSRHIDIAVGFVEVSSDFHFYNSAVYLEGGEIRHLHRKVYLPTYGLFDEQRYLAPGDRFRAFDTRFGRMGLLICEDMWHLSAPYILAMDGATTLLCLSSSPGRGISESDTLGSTASWQKLTSATAMFLNSRVLYCNRVGYEDGVNFWGGSEVIDPSGTVSVRGAILEEDFVMAGISEAALRRERISSPMMRDENLFITLKELKRIGKERNR
jgi:predicted amidohydrolase